MYRFEKDRIYSIAVKTNEPKDYTLYNCMIVPDGNVLGIADYLHSIDAEPGGTIRVRRAKSFTDEQYADVVRGLWERGFEPIDSETLKTIYLDRPNQGYWKWNGVNDYTDEFTDFTPVELI